MKNYIAIRDLQDDIALRQEIQKILLQHDGRKAKMMEVVEDNKKLYCLFQGYNESINCYLRAHIEQYEVIKDNEGHLS